MHWCCLPCSSPLCKQNWRVCPKVRPTPCTSLSILIFLTDSLKNWITQVWQADPLLWRGQALRDGLARRPRCSLSHINSLCPSHLPPRYRKVKKLPFHSTNQFLCKACGSFPNLKLRHQVPLPWEVCRLPQPLLSPSCHGLHSQALGRYYKANIMLIRLNFKLSGTIKQMLYILRLSLNPS